jgi:predicted enzyme related to lactoylglutathione lyase
MGRPVHFEIHAGDPERARRFYETALGWHFQQWGSEPYWLVTTGEGPGIDGGLVPRQGPDPDPGLPVGTWVVTVGVQSCAAAVESVVAAGGSVAVAPAPVPGVGWLAYLRDTEGNLFGVIDDDTSAA